MSLNCWQQQQMLHNNLRYKSLFANTSIHSNHAIQFWKSFSIENPAPAMRYFFLKHNARERNRHNESHSRHSFSKSPAESGSKLKHNDDIQPRSIAHRPNGYLLHGNPFTSLVLLLLTAKDEKPSAAAASFSWGFKRDRRRLERRCCWRREERRR